MIATQTNKFEANIILCSIPNALMCCFMISRMKSDYFPLQH